MNKPIWEDGSGGKPLRTTGTVQSITDRKSAENALTGSGVLHATVASIAALINSSSLEEGAPKALRLVGEALDVDRCVVVENVDRPGAPLNMVPSYQWNKSGLEPLLPPFVAELIKHPDVRSWLAPLSENKPVVTTLTNANATVQGILRALKSTSILLIPILVAGRNWGHIGLNDGTPNREWSAAEIETLLALATLFGVTIERGRQIRKLADADAIIRSSPTVLYRLSLEPGMPMTYVSPNVVRLGYDQAKMLAEPTFYRTLIHPDDRDRVANEEARALCEQTPDAVFDVRVLTAHGTYRWFQVHRKWIMGPDGKPTSLEGEFIDIDERKRAEDELNKSHALLESAERLGHVGAWEWEIVHDRVVWSDELYRICGRNPEDFVPTLADFFACVHPDDRARVKAAHDAALTRQQPFDIELRIVRPDGEVRFARAQSNVTLDTAGNAARITGSFHDITEHKESESALKQERDFSAALIDSVPGFLVLIDENGRYVRWNQNLPAITGISNEQLQGFDAFAIIVENDRDMVRKAFLEALTKGCADVEFKVRAKSGDVHTILLSGRAITKGRRRYIVNAGIDVTDLRKAEALLRAVAVGATEIGITTKLDEFDPESDGGGEHGHPNRSHGRLGVLRHARFRAGLSIRVEQSRYRDQNRRTLFREPQDVDAAIGDLASAT